MSDEWGARWIRSGPVVVAVLGAVARYSWIELSPVFGILISLVVFACVILHTFCRFAQACREPSGAEPLWLMVRLPSFFVGFVLMGWCDHAAIRLTGEFLAPRVSDIADKMEAFHARTGRWPASLAEAGAPELPWPFSALDHGIAGTSKGERPRFYLRFDQGGFWFDLERRGGDRGALRWARWRHEPTASFPLDGTEARWGSTPD